MSITPQKIGANYASSVADFVGYLEKENEGKPREDMEFFFNQYDDAVSNKTVIHDIDSNTSKLKKSEPKFYALTVSPSQHELKHLKNHSQDLKAYTRALMEDYAKAFNREIDGRPIHVDDIVYYAKVEHERIYKGMDKAIQENAPFQKKIVRLRHDILKIEQGKLQGDRKAILRQIKQLNADAPHQLNGQMIVQGMPKQGAQSHIHIIMSRKDKSNRYSLSPGSKYKASEVEMNGKIVKRGFNRDVFFSNSEKTFDKKFQYNRNYVESYKARKLFIKNPQKYLASIMGLPTTQKAIAFKMLSKAGVNTTLLNLPTNKVQLMLKAIKYLKRSIGKAIESGSIGI